ncbi:DUF4919 domain-containing protein [Bacteroidales bacterium OttesenSCG-928-B11]|nr:DUF4919 domain-containing protein [Bacteroidales bacterium OttesenSCG-928-B11]
MTVILFAVNVTLFSQTAEEWKKLGNAELDSANYDKAIECYQKALEVDSTYLDAYYNLGLAFAGRKEYEKSIDFLRKAITIKDTEADIYFLLGSVYAEQKEYDEAIEMFKKGIALEPHSPEVYSHLGFLYQEKGSYVYAMLYFKKAAQLGDTLARQYFTENEISWEDHFVEPDYKQIQRDIKNKQSNFYYAKLWERYRQGDTTMTLGEKRHLYYGYVFHKNYAPYGSAHNSKQVNAILDKENPTQKEWKQLVSLLDASLAVEPFNFRYLYYQSIAYKYLDNMLESQKNMQKIESIIDALLSTGDGLTKETAIHVIAVSSEYDYLFMNNLSMKSQALVNGGFDVLYLQPNEDGLEEMWFDVSQSLNYLNSSK